jgi:hypothetical protein
LFLGDFDNMDFVTNAPMVYMAVEVEQIQKCFITQGVFFSPNKLTILCYFSQFYISVWEN